MNAAIRLAILTLISLPLFPQAAARADGLEGGVAAADITPPIPYRMSGYFNERLSEGVHDPLLAKAFVFRQGDVKAALVFCDLVGVSPQAAAEARQAAAKATGIPSENILIAATHSHTGPLYFGALREHFHRLAVEKQGTDPYEQIDYPAQLVERIVQAIVEAHRSAGPVTLSAGVAMQEGLSFNRRFHMKDGAVRFNPGKQNPDIVRAAGPIDPQVGLLLVRAGQGNRPLASLAVFALHLDTVGGVEYSADYPYYLGQTLQQRFGDDFISAFGAGTCGDINHIDVTTSAAQKGQTEAQRIGAALGKTVSTALENLRPLERPSLAVRRAIVNAPLQQYDEKRTAQAEADMLKIGTRELGFLEQVEAYKIFALKLRGGDRLPIEVQAFRFSDDTALVGLPGEVFVELGLAIKQASPFANTLVVELCNDTPGYIPTKRAFAEGSYETVNSRVTSGGGELMVEAAVRLLNELAPPPQ